MLFYFKDIAYSLGPTQQRQISVSGSVNDGETLVIRGPSGAGKSTLLRGLARLQPCISGKVFLKNKDWMQIPGTKWRTEVHYLAQRPALFDGTVADNLAKPFETHVVKNKKEFNQSFAKAIMNDLLLPSSLWHQDARTLSGGEAARMAFVRALLIDPIILLLDEPTAALDDKAREAFYKVLSNWLSTPNRAAILISHNDDYKVLDNISYLYIKQ